MIYEISEIIPLEQKLEQIKQDMKYANTMEEQNEYIRQAMALKQLIADKRKAKKVGGK